MQIEMLKMYITKNNALTICIKRNSKKIDEKFGINLKCFNRIFLFMSFLSRCISSEAKLNFSKNSFALKICHE